MDRTYFFPPSSSSTPLPAGPPLSPQPHKSGISDWCGSAPTGEPGAVLDRLGRQAAALASAALAQAKVAAVGRPLPGHRRGARHHRHSAAQKTRLGERIEVESHPYFPPSPSPPYFPPHVMVYPSDFYFSPQAEADSITDAIVRDIVGPPADYRPGIFETKSRMRYLTSLSFKGASVV